MEISRSSEYPQLLGILTNSIFWLVNPFEVWITIDKTAIMFELVRRDVVKFVYVKEPTVAWLVHTIVFCFVLGCVTRRLFVTGFFQCR
jgi:hypothetical protein